MFNATKQKIPKAQEEVLVQWCLELSSCNLPLDCSNLLQFATTVHEWESGDEANDIE